MHLSPSSWPSLPPPTPCHTLKLSQSTYLSSLSHTANSHWLSILHTVVYTFPSGSWYLLPNCFPIGFHWGFLGGSAVKNLLQCKRHGFDPCVRKIPWRRAWQPAPVFFPEESRGQRSLVGYIQSIGSRRVGSSWARMHTGFHSFIMPLEILEYPFHCI